MGARILALPIAMLVAALPSGAATVVLEPVRDATLYEHPAGEKANGSGAYLFAGRTLEAENFRRRALVAFDVASAIPAGSTIRSARLRLHMSRTIAGAVPVSLHRLLADWGEGASDAPREEGDGAPAAPGDATWIHRFYDGVFWERPGGDFDPEPSATALVGLDGTYEWGPDDRMTADVQSWLDEPERNFGWILVADESAAPTAKRFDSRENPVPANRPQLVIEFDPPVAMAEFAPRTGSVRFGRRSDAFRVAGRFRLGDGSDGIDPATEPVTFRFGSFERRLPPGSFRCRDGRCLFTARGPGLTRLLIAKNAFAAEGRGVDLGGTSLPVQVVLSIGNDVGRGPLPLFGVLRAAPALRAGGEGPGEAAVRRRP